MDKIGQIIAIGGGGFGRNPNQPIIEKYIIEQAENSNPNVCFIPTASAEEKGYIVNFYSAFNKFNCNLRHIALFQRTPNLRSIINKQDIIFVGGGNTKSMLAVWKEWKLDQLLIKAYNRGAILCGVSAGAICWFEKGITDSWASNLSVLDCMGLVKGNCCPHYNGEKDRKPSLEKFLADSLLSSCYAIDDGAAIHYREGKIFRAVSFFKGAHAYEVTMKNNQIDHCIIEGITIHD